MTCTVHSVSLKFYFGTLLLWKPSFSTHMVSYQALTAVFCIILLAIQDLQLPTLAYSGSGCEFVCLDIDYLFEESKKKKAKSKERLLCQRGS